jgi:transposase-like protein
MLSIVASEQAEQDALKLDLDALVREGARRMLVAALKAEVDEYVAQHADHRDEVGHALVVRNGVAEPRTVTTAAGELEIQTPRVHDRREGRRFTSAILPPWARRSPKVTEVLPVLYLRGISTRDFEPALAEFFGSEAGLSASTVQRLTREWCHELAAFQQRDLSQVDYVYLWADGVHFNIRLEHERLCCLVLIGVRADGHKELVAVGDGYRESTESWSELLRDLKRRGMRAPVLAIGDGALGFWGALREVFPESREQRCWVHKVANVLDAVPSSLQPKVKAADQALDQFQATYSAKYPKAVDKVIKDRDVLLTHFDFPADHWVHLRTTNAIESSFATVKLRTRKTKGAGSRAAGLAMAYKLLAAAQARWRSVNAPHLVALVRAGATFVDGFIIEREDQRCAA